MVITNQRLTNLIEELRLTNQSFAQLAQFLDMTLIMIHYNHVAHAICVSIMNKIDQKTIIVIKQHIVPNLNIKNIL